MKHACVFMVLLLSLAWVFPGVTMFFSLVFPVLDSHGVLGCLVLVEIFYGWI